jgi:hypothetical protein
VSRRIARAIPSVTLRLGRAEFACKKKWYENLMDLEYRSYCEFILKVVIFYDNNDTLIWE